MKKLLSVLLFLFISIYSFGQLKITDVGDGWKNKVDSALKIIQTYDIEKYNVILETCTLIGYWNESFSTTEGDSVILISTKDINNESINNIAAILVHESMHLYIKQLYAKVNPNREETICYVYELNFLYKVPNVEPWLIENATSKIKYYSKQ
jgi:hypothetical protein